MRHKLISIIGMGIGILFGLWWAKRIVWTGFYYPNIDKMEEWIVSPPLWSLEQCRNWVNVVHKDGDNYDYECGQGCRLTMELGGITICRTTHE